MPKDGKPKGPGRRVSPRLKQVGEAVGIDFTGKTDRYPNSIAAHTLLDYVGKNDPTKQHQLQEVLFRHYFTDGRYPDLTNLKAAAVEVGVKDSDAATKFAADSRAQAHVREEALHYSVQGINGVPYFFANGRPLGSGAQPVESLVEAFRTV